MELSKTIQTENKKENLGRRLLSGIVNYLLPLTLTVALVCYMFINVNFSDMTDILCDNVDYGWILTAMGLSIFSHIFRAMRWRLQFRSLGVNPPLLPLTCSIFGTYALNLVFPRLGEIWRCSYVSHRERIPFTKVFGSMIADRLADTLTVLLLTVIAFILGGEALSAFVSKYPIGENLISKLKNPFFWIIVACMTVAVLTLIRLLRGTRFITKIHQAITELWHGFSGIVSMKEKSMFLFLTVCIWGCYFFQLYLAFFAFPFTRKLCTETHLAFGLLPCLITFVISSISMAVPSNGGLGPWNIAVIFGLALYGVENAVATAFSVVVWSGQTVMLIILGIFTMIYISCSQRHLKRFPPERITDKIS